MELGAVLQNILEWLRVMTDLALNPYFQVGREKLKNSFSDHLEVAFWPVVLQGEMSAP